MFFFLHSTFIFSLSFYSRILFGKTLHYPFPSPPLLKQESCCLRTDIQCHHLSWAFQGHCGSPQTFPCGIPVVLTQATPLSSSWSWYGIKESSSLIALVVEVMQCNPRSWGFHVNFLFHLNSNLLGKNCKNVTSYPRRYYHCT